MPRWDKPMYELEYPAPTVQPGNDAGSPPLTLIVALQGYADAGNAIRGVVEHLVAALDHQLIAAFDIDELVDYRSRRPAVMIDSTEVTPFEDIMLNLTLMRDVKGNPFLLLYGVEPDIRWNAFANAVAELVERYNVDQTIALYSAPMSVPHTRPLMVSAHANRPYLADRLYQSDTNVVVPGAAALRIEHMLNERSQAVAGYTAYVPAYIASSDYPEASLQLLKAVSNNCELHMPLNALRHDVDAVNKQIKQHMDQSKELQHAVRNFEVQYDEHMAEFRKQNPQALLANAELPSSEELGAEFEQFLASGGSSQSPAPREEIPQDTPSHDEPDDDDRGDHHDDDRDSDGNGSND